MSNLDADNQSFRIPPNLRPRCKRAYGWSEEFSSRAMKGYQVFMKLKILQEDWEATILSPSLTVDLVWHQHLLDNGNYEKACQDFCGRSIHHNPDGGLDPVAREARVKATKLCLKTLLGRQVDWDVWSFGSSDDSDAEEEAGRDDKDHSDHNDDDDDLDDEEEASPRKRSRRIPKSIAVKFQIHFQSERQVSLTAVSKTTPTKDLFSEFVNQAGLYLETVDFWYINQKVREDGTLQDMVPCKHTREFCLTIKVSRAHSNAHKKYDTERAITIRVRDQTGEETFFKLRKASQIEKVFSAYARRKGVNVNDLRFLLDGERIEPWHTPATLELEDSDQIDCMLEQTGC